ncbi:MAG TPA: flagellar hook basal-body protein [Candidatus Sulfotelmatobacter sp.]|jgi:flagellar basal-body rod protein FlgF
MDSGYYAACTGLAAQTQALELIANNLANLGTTGYRAQQATFRSLLAGPGTVPLNPLNAVINSFGLLSGSRVDETPANLSATGNPLDLGLGGKGFFAVQSGQQILYTRNGSFHVAPNGQLMTASGATVLAEQTNLLAPPVPVSLPAGAVTVSADGTISVNSAVVAKLRLAEFSPETSLTAEGNSLYSAPANAEQPAPATSVHQGMLENSNVNPMVSVVQLITVQRNTEMLQRALTVLDSQLNLAAVQDLPHV